MADFILINPLRFGVPTASAETLSPTDLADQAQRIDSPATARSAIRQSLRASTMDGVFASLFSNTTSGALLSGFVLALGGSATEIGWIAAIPWLANLVQPIGANLSERMPSRAHYCFWIYSVARSLWIFLAISIGWASWYGLNDRWLLWITLATSLASHLLGALGSAAWMSWMAVLVPRRLRGRYFGFRNSASNLTSLISVPLLGLLVSKGLGGTVQSYGMVLSLGIAAGLISLSYQRFMVDVNPQTQHTLPEATNSRLTQPATKASLIAFLCYFALWTFSFNLSAPFFNVYLLNSVHLDLGQVTFYNSLCAAANLATMVLWGKLADRIGNRSVLIGIGILVALMPLLWLGTGADSLSIWLWFPLLHLLSGAICAAIELCSQNLQLGIAPLQQQSTYFGIAAALAGISGALGSIAGGALTQIDHIAGLGLGGLLGLFVLSSLLRCVALFPLVFVHETHGQSLRQLMLLLFPKLARST